MTTPQPWQIAGRFWIEGPDGTFLGHGRVKLLENIAEYGSISAAARAMKMSYKRAWKLVDSMNRHGQVPAVQLSTGGKGGGGATLTMAGQNAIDCYHTVHREFLTFMQEKTEKLTL